MRVVKIIKSIVISFFSFKFLLGICLIFALHFYLSINFYGYDKETSSINHLILFFYGPQNIRVGFLTWLFHQVPIIILIGFLLNKELKEHIIYKLSRIRSFPIWISSLIISSFILIFIYYTIGFVEQSILLNFFHGSHTSFEGTSLLILLNKYNPLSLLIHQFLLLVLGTFFIVLVNFCISLFLKNSTAAFAVNMMGVYLSITIGSTYPYLKKWLPFTHGFLTMHDARNFTLQWSYIYLFIAINVTLIIITAIYTKRLEKILISQGGDG